MKKAIRFLIVFFSLATGIVQAQEADAIKGFKVFDTASTQSSSWNPAPPLLAGILGISGCHHSSPQVAVPDESVSLLPSDALNEEKIGIAAKFIPIAPGTFLMGSPEDERGRESDEPKHQVTLTKPFEIQATEVTQLQYFLITGKNPSHFKYQTGCDPGNFKIIFGMPLCANHPVENISWDEIAGPNGFIEILNQSQAQYTYRIPTEAEWEYVARAGTDPYFPYFFGYNDNNEIDRYAWSYNYGYSDSRTHAVATKQPSPWGLYDIYGNVWELVQDFYQDSYRPPNNVYSTRGVFDPVYNTGSRRVFRGGSWDSAAAWMRSSNRGLSPGISIGSLGLRLVRSPR